MPIEFFTLILYVGGRTCALNVKHFLLLRGTRHYDICNIINCFRHILRRVCMDNL